MTEPEIILGPPGTGKTTTLLGIVEEELARGTPPDRIAFVTFTRRGAREGAERASAKFNIPTRDLRYFRTIHSWAFHHAGLGNGDVLEGKKMLEFADWIGEPVSEYRSSDEGSTFGFTPADRALFMENLARVRCVPLRQQYEEDSDGLSWSYVDKISRGLTQFKKETNLVDFTDMLQQFVDQGFSEQLDVLIVDEFQDLSQLQIKVIMMLARGVRRFVIAGDDDQAIYRWAGADVESFVSMPGRARVLGQSYRVPATGQAVAQEVIDRVRRRRPKQWAARALTQSLEDKGYTERGAVRRVQNLWDVNFSGQDVLVLGRNAYVLNGVMSHLRREGIVFEWRGHSSVSGKLLESIRAWEVLRKGGDVAADEVRRIYEFMSSGKGVKRGHKTLPGFDDADRVQLSALQMRGGLLTDAIWHEALDRIPQDDKMYILRALKRGESLRKEPRVRVSTIHGAKGGESDHVVLFRDMASRTHAEMLRSPEDEARVWYVGATRTKEDLTIVAPRTSQNYDI